MIARSFYTLKLMSQHRSALRSFCSDSANHIDSIVNLDVSLLSKRAHILALDFDGVLAAHGKPELEASVEQWLRTLIQQVSPERIVILSNKPTAQRRDYFKRNFEGVDFIGGVRKKPYPDGLQVICEQKAVPASEVLLIDDRLLTGVLATIEAGSQAIWITKAFSSFKHDFVGECFFAFLRWMERLIYL